MCVHVYVCVGMSAMCGYECAFLNVSMVEYGNVTERWMSNTNPATEHAKPLMSRTIPELHNQEDTYTYTLSCLLPSLHALVRKRKKEKNATIKLAFF